MEGAEFDFIVVGAGSAGCVVAERLSQSGRYSVCVIEAGGSDRRFFVQMPLGYGKTFHDPSINWGYHAEPDPGLAGQSDYWPRGKILGGSGSINAMVWIRGDARDFDNWAAEGNPGWSYADVLPVFRAIEDNSAGADLWRARGGPVHITDQTPMLHPLARRFLEAAQQEGFAANPDFNGKTQEGVGVFQVNTKHGRRLSSARAFLKPCMSRQNVLALQESLATRIVFEGRRAVGVEVMTGGQRRVLRARCEVILSAGSVNTPTLLHRSGIGPGDHLRRIRLPVLVDSPAVGHHLQDHVGINYLYRATVPSLNEVLRPWWGLASAGLRYLLSGSGPLATSLNQGGGFVKTRPDLPRPNMQLYFQPITTTTARKGSRPLLRPDPFPGYALGLSNCNPTSRGSVLARSPEAQDAPVIRANAYSTAKDITEMLEAVKLLRRIAARPALASITAEELAPGPAITSDDALEADLRQRSGTVYHPCGTARMAPDIERGAVDARLKVHGVEGLRIVDASIFPSIPSGNINAPTIMVGWKGATLILEDAK